MPHTPTHLIYHGKATGAVRGGFPGRQASKKIWTKIGAVWPNKSGKGGTLTWDYMPLANGITVMLPYDKKYDKDDDEPHLVPDDYPA